MQAKSYWPMKDRQRQRRGLTTLEMKHWRIKAQRELAVPELDVSVNLAIAHDLCYWVVPFKYEWMKER